MSRRARHDDLDGAAGVELIDCIGRFYRLRLPLPYSAGAVLNTPAVRSKPGNGRNRKPGKPAGCWNSGKPGWCGRSRRKPKRRHAAAGGERQARMKGGATA